MARVEYGGGITSVKGKIGGWVFQGVNKQNIIRAKGKPLKSISTRQTSAQQLLQGLLYQWSLLTLLKKIDWNDFAALHDRVDVFGNTKKLTGLNWFMSINSALVGMGESLIQDPPTYATPDAIPNYTLDLSNNAIIINFGGVTTFANNGFLIYASNISQSASLLNFSRMRAIGYYPHDDYNQINITSLWDNAWGVDYANLTSDNKFVLSVVLIPLHKTSGVSGAGLFINAEYVD